VDSTAIKNTLKAQEKGLDNEGGMVGPYTCTGSASNCGSTFRTNLEERYRIIGVSGTIPAFESYAFKLDTTAPTVESTSPSNSATVSTGVYVPVTFSEEMDNTTITNNNSDTSCSSGTFQISANNFQNCLKFTHDNFVISNSEKTFRMTGFSLSGSSKLRITSGATDVAGNSLSTLTISF
jgi:hypothetical protein